MLAMRLLGLLFLALGAAVLGISLTSPPPMIAEPAIVEFLSSESAVYAGGGSAAVGLALLLVSFAGSKRRRDALRDDLSAAPADEVSSKTDFFPAAAPEPMTLAPVARSATAQRVFDLTQVRNALEAYRSAKGTYPESNGWQGYASAYGATLGDNWIPELVPDYLAVLPRDPSMTDRGELAQYLYYSTGQDYKLIAHRAGDFTPALETAIVQRDPRRPDATQPSNSAYGCWSESGIHF